MEFFREAAQHGDLYVRIGSSANIKALKNHDTMYSDAERLFMVKNLSCVKDAAISVGTGRFDFVRDAELIKPDIYFVNEDASKLEERMSLFSQAGLKVQIIVAHRKPAEGLEERSSTSMKERLAAMVKQDEPAKQSLPMSAFHQTIPWRFCFCGGWMDLKWCNEFWSGCVVTINIKFNPGICKDECGLATSSRKVAAALWNGEVPQYLDPLKAAKFLWGAENFDAAATEERTYWAGSQDHCGLMFAGVNKLCYAGGRHWPYKVISLNNPADPQQAAMFRWLESVVHIVEIPFVSRPPGYSSQEINYIKDPDVPVATKRTMVRALAEASEAAWDAILAMDSRALGKALSDTMAAWGAMLPYTTDPYFGKDAAKSEELRAFVARYDAPHTKGCLFSGAGGGFLMVISDEHVEGGLRMAINHESPCMPYKSATLVEAHDAPKAGPPPATPQWGVLSPWHLDIYGNPFPTVTPRYAKVAVMVATTAALALGVAIGRRLK